MRKTMALILALAMVFTLCACGQEESFSKTAESVSKAAASTQEADIPEVYVSGNTIESDTLQIEILGIYFGDALSANGQTLAPDNDNMTLGMIHMKVKNTGKESLNLGKALDVSLEYADGYIYSTRSSEFFLTLPDDPSMYLSFHRNGNSYSAKHIGDVWDLSPLVELDCILSIPCAKEIASDESSALKVIFTLPDEGVDKAFVCDVSTMILGEYAPASSGAVDARISVEETYIRKRSSNSLGMKVRNNGDEAKEIIALNTQLLDNNGDILAAVDLYAYNLDVGQAGDTDFERINCDLNEIAAIKVIGYKYGTGSDLIRKFNTADSFKLSNPIIIAIDDVTIE